MDYLDGRVLSRVKVGRNNNPDLVDDADDDAWSRASDADDGDAEDGSASWETITDVPGERERESSASASRDSLSSSSSSSTSARDSSHSRGDANPLADPLADPGRKPDFVFTLGGASDSDAPGIRTDDRGAASDGAGGFRPTAGTKAYTLEKRQRPIGDAVTDRTQRDPSVAAEARAAADAAKRTAARSAGVVADVHTNITVLFPETFDDATALARRPADGVGLGRAGGLDVDGGVDGGVEGGVDGGVEGDVETSSTKSGSGSGSARSADGSDKRRWLVAFCARWAPPCNLLVREFALLGSDPALREFALGWVDCTPARMTHFCGARFAVEGYPSVYLIAGGRAMRYSAAERERLAPAISRWAVQEAARVDQHAPNAGTPAPGIPVPPPTGEREPPEEGRRGARAFSEANELEALRRERDRMRAEYAAEEERRARRKKARAGAGADAEAKRKAKRGREEGETTTAPKMSRRRAAREAAKAREANRRGSEL